MGTGDILLGGNPAMNKHSVQGGVAILLGTLHAKEIGISFGRLGLWLVCAYLVVVVNRVHTKNCNHFSRTF